MMEFLLKLKSPSHTKKQLYKGLLFIICLSAISPKNYGVSAILDKTEQDYESQIFCETKTLDNLPPDPVRFHFKIFN